MFEKKTAEWYFVRDLLPAVLGVAVRIEVSFRSLFLEHILDKCDLSMYIFCGKEEPGVLWWCNVVRMYI